LELQQKDPFGGRPERSETRRKLWSSFATLPALVPALLQEGGKASEVVGEAAKEETGNVFIYLFHHVIPSATGYKVDFGAIQFQIFNIQFFQVIAVLLMFLLFFPLVGKLRKGGKMGWLSRVFSGFVLYIRDEMVKPIMGEKGAKTFLPYFLFVFFFIAFQNLLGLLPHGATATASIFVTGALAATTLAMMVGGGIFTQGFFGFWKGLIPHGLPPLLVPLLFVVEIIGLLAKPFALTVRLFANMLAGHFVVLSFMGLIFYAAGGIGKLAYGVAVPSVGLAVFIMIIEGFVALLQAYIFTYLSILFIQMSMHPDH
jgi:F-type H+-transporting ATPase subunit a